MKTKEEVEEKIRVLREQSDCEGNIVVVHALDAKISILNWVLERAGEQ